jgi:formyltetrahydrofolate deformylase
MQEKILTICCPDTKGLIFKVAERLFELKAQILDSSHYSDSNSNLFFMRLHLLFDAPIDNLSLYQKLESLKNKLHLELNVYDFGQKTKTLILCSKESHCLIELMSRVFRGALNLDVQKIISNHEDLKEISDWFKTPFLHLPITKQNKTTQEATLQKIIDDEKIELVILARYMQILSADLCEKLNSRCINIHHSFLPSFKGANPYKQAFDRGVKMIGATSHFVTEDLDEGPILFQETLDVSHKHTYEELKEMGRTVEARVLSSAVESFCDKRIFTNGKKTVIL